MANSDVYNALRSKRCYKHLMIRSQCREIILNTGSSQFDPVVVDAFSAAEEELTGSGVKWDLPEIRHQQPL